MKEQHYEPLHPITTPGNNPENPVEYDYWDHLEHIVDSAASKGMYVILLPAWGSCVAGNYGNGHPSAEIIFDIDKARKYGSWLGHRFAKKTNLVWMLGGDRSAVYGNYDYRPVFRAMAQGITTGVNGAHAQGSGAGSDSVLISYHPQKWQANSSAWFHHDAWLDFNSIQDQPRDQIQAVEHDYALQPAKPTWLFEGGYEHRGNIYTDWHIRYQSYQTVFAGGFGVTYGNMNIYNFGGQTGTADEPGSESVKQKWEKSLEDPGGKQMQYLLQLMTSWTNDQFLARVPDQGLIDGDAGGMEGGEGIRSDRLQATRGRKGDYAMIYSANGRPIRVNMKRLTGPRMNAFWFDPRTGEWWNQGQGSKTQMPFKKNIPTGANAPICEFDPPGNATAGNDWVLVLKLAE